MTYTVSYKFQTNLRSRFRRFVAIFTDSSVYTRKRSFSSGSSLTKPRKFSATVRKEVDSRGKLTGKKRRTNRLDDGRFVRSFVRSTHQINGDDEIVLLPLALLLVLAGLHGGRLGRHLHLALLCRRLLGRFRLALGARRDLLSGRRRLLAGSALLIHVTYAIRRFVARLRGERQNRR